MDFRLIIPNKWISLILCCSWRCDYIKIRLITVCSVTISLWRWCGGWDVRAAKMLLWEVWNEHWTLNTVCACVFVCVCMCVCVSRQKHFFNDLAKSTNQAPSSFHFNVVPGFKPGECLLLTRLLSNLQLSQVIYSSEKLYVIKAGSYNC